MTAKKKADDEYTVLTAAERLPIIRDTLRAREMDLYRAEIVALDSTSDPSHPQVTQLDALKESVAKLREEYEKVASAATEG